MTHLRSNLLALFILFPFWIAAQTADSPYATSLSSIPAKDVGIYIEDLRTGDVILDVNGEKLFTPASVTKLVTTSTALNTSKPNARFTTDVVAQGDIKDGVLHGNIIIKACGDPTIESKHFPSNKGFVEKAVAGVKALGISEITGTVVAKYRKEYEQPTPAGWMSEDLIHPYGTEFHAVNFMDNVISASPAGRTTPETPGITIKKSGRNRRERGSTVVELAGAMQIANPNPESTLCRAIQLSLEKNGIKVGDLWE